MTKRSEILCRIRRHQEALLKAHEFLVTGAHGHWSGFLPLFRSRPNRLPHPDWIANVIPPEAARANQAVVVGAHSGMDFPKSDHAPDPAAFARRILIGPEGRHGKIEPAGREERSGLLRFDPGQDGIYIVAVETNPKLITLEADAFNEYLVADGLSHIYRQRSKEKTLNQPGRERYSKSPKALIQVAESREGDPCRIVGLPLEIVPLHNPFTLKAGETLRVRVLFRDKPLAEANLGWQHTGDGLTPRGTVRTDERGEALVPIARSGLMTIRLTHMTRPQTADYEWESFWTTLTFRVP